MNVTILNVTVSTSAPNSRGTTHQTADVAYKNNSFQGKVEGKKIVSFGKTETAFKVLAVAQPGETYDVEVVKNDKGYNDWISMVKAGVVQESAAASSVGQTRGTGNTSPRSTYETPEERALRQRSIVRQSSISNAVNTLAVGAKKVTPEEVIAVAKMYETYVASNEVFTGGATGFDDVPNFPINSQFKPE